ncbi:hypothetical protein CWE12_07025 [Aliidiomarina sedimenti]|uniref:RRXRR domain-containing protein n=1 Tax=Aliidiomarina sedimenti TaxID=1933879 RepID=A0ABY0BYG1_9GAMM|nr:hypothetical protein CWE12_07025 [Aliidiomarina sedimenti]
MICILNSLTKIQDLYISLDKGPSVIGIAIFNTKNHLMKAGLHLKFSATLKYLSLRQVTRRRRHGFFWR